MSTRSRSSSLSKSRLWTVPETALPMETQHQQDKLSSDEHQQRARDLRKQYSAGPDPEAEPDDQEVDDSDGGYGWVVVFAAFATNFIADGVTFTFGVLFVDLLRVFGEAKSHTASVGGLFMAMPLLAGPVASALAERYGCRVVCMVGAVVAAAGMSASAWAHSLAQLLVSFGVVAGAGLALCYVAAVVTVALHFRRRRALATGLAVCGSGMGTLAFAPLSARLLESLGWRPTALALAALFLHIAVCGALMRPPQRKKKNVQSKKTKLKGELVQNKPETKELLSGLRETSAKQSVQHAISPAVRAVARSENENRPFHSVLNIPTWVHAGDQHLPPDVAARAKQREPLSPPPPRAIDRHRHSLTFRGALLPTQTQRTLSCPNLWSEPIFLEYKEQEQPCLSEMVGILAGMVDVSHFADARFSLFAASNFLLYTWYEVPYVFLTDRAVEMGISENDASLLISALGLLNMVGMVILGWMGDRPKVNAVAVYAVCMTVCGLCTAVVPLVHTYIGLMIIACIFGLSISANYTLASIILVEMVSLERFTNGYGLLLLVQGLGNIIGPPLAGWLYDISGSYDLSFYLAGLFIILSGLLLFVLPVCRWCKKLKSLKNVSGNETIT
ncbi:monocarboxylate transporter 13-like isoform X2 [Schistocerca gregaria]|nr:monocarboxylate transporter 13-like isoform X2 [Schistocerca gregaria]XP_049857263.1 monocarboxylate transporter 13-like isoform X2 [Schistocerca gregaria]